MIIFKYRREPTGSGFTQRPVADVYFKSQSGSWIEFHPYIDSGADVTLIPLTLGKLIGFELKKNKIEQIGGIRGSVPIVYQQAKMRVGGIQLTTKVAWALIEDVPPLLGRADIFDRFIITFKQKNGTIVFEERDIKRSKTASPPPDKNAFLKSAAGAWKGTSLDKDPLWKDVLKKKSRKKNPQS